MSGQSAPPGGLPSAHFSWAIFQAKGDSAWRSVPAETRFITGWKQIQFRAALEVHCSKYANNNKKNNNNKVFFTESGMLMKEMKIRGFS